MAGWGKETDNSQNGNDNFGANTVPYKFVKSDEPFGSGALTKRNVIATDRGWVRRQNFIDNLGNHRTKDEILIAGDEFASGNPYVVEVYTNGSTANSANVYVVFSEPVFHGKNARNLTLTAKQGSNTVTFTANSGNGLTDIVNANNTIVFKASSIFSGRYKVEGQTIAGAGNAANLVSLNDGGGTANLVISGATSNALGTFIF